MSTLRLNEDHPKYGRKGQTVTVPFLEAQTLVAAGRAVRPGAEQSLPAPAPSAGRPGPDAETAALRKRAESAEADLAAIRAEIERLSAAVADLKESVAEAEKRAAAAEKRAEAAEARAAAAEKAASGKKNN